MLLQIGVSLNPSGATLRVEEEYTPERTLARARFQDMREICLEFRDKVKRSESVPSLESI